MTNLSDLIDRLGLLSYEQTTPVPHAPLPLLAEAQKALTDDGDTFDLSDNYALRLRITPDPDASINDYDADGRIAWGTRSEYGSVRPDGFDGRARIIKRDRGSSLWWQPPSIDGCLGTEWTPEQFRTEEARIRELVEYGFSIVWLDLMEKIEDSTDGEHTVEIETASLGGVDSMYPELISELASEIEASLTDQRAMSRPNGSCDVCDAPIGDAQIGPRLCTADPSHDCYSDGFQNGGDPFEPETIKVGHMEQYETVTCRNEDCQNHGTSFVRDDLFQSDDDDAICPDCGAPLMGQGTPPKKFGVVISERVLVSDGNVELVDLLRHIADQIEQGNVSGFDPAWEIV